MKKQTPKQKKEWRTARRNALALVVIMFMSPVIDAGVKRANAHNHLPMAAPAPIREYPLDAVRSVYAETPETPETVEQAVRRIAAERGFRWPDYLVRLAKCESNLDPAATNDRNNNPAHSKDRGLFQINDYWHSEVPDEVAYDLEKATEWTMRMIESGRQGEWVCDKYI